MTNKKSTKRALLVSLLAMLLSVTMLVGTTFAWFTDSVTSSGNIIKSGTLDLEVSVADEIDGTYTSIEGTPVFNYENWEPGYTTVKFIKIQNIGSLAFKSALNIILDNRNKYGKSTKQLNLTL